ncbi:hypothetical protein EJ08DRAFT_670707 [Tothia fuscella]|uniref:Uncharacterized protein n=1 Tax=Tothia fuscella TaxID=1048955 RepID=A0A9P4NR75_9PEZI|nr:hypothetical protein EJ08DRAFT_670707 [Tothia fuscella]
MGLRGLFFCAFAAYSTSIPTNVVTRSDDKFEWTALGDSLGGGNHIFNNVVSSGSNTQDVENYQFYYEDTSGKPSRQYAHIYGLPKAIPCDEQLEKSRKLIEDPNLVTKLDHVIKKTVKRGREGTIGNNFKLYVTGFAEFFNQDDPGCNDVTFARTANPKPDGKEHNKLTIKLRTDFNEMSVGLNAAIEEAVNLNKDQGVRFIDIQAGGALDGHRFCEPSIKEPDQQNDKLWFWHYPYNEPPDDDLDSILQSAYRNATTGLATMDDVHNKYQTEADLMNAVFDAVDPGNEGIQDPFWLRVGKRVKMFHPQVAFNIHIKDLILKAWLADTSTDRNQCHGIGGDLWVVSRDVAANNVATFCAQGSKSIEYNTGTVNHLRLSVGNPSDQSKGPLVAPDCVDRFTKAVIDGCDGQDLVNNPHNYKFGSTFTAADGWVYKMEPLYKQEDEVTCDVSWKVAFNGFEIRGKNFPDAKLGANGEGLKKQVSGCGSLTKWHFEFTPKDVKFQWFASGQLPVGTKACVGRALESSGAPAHIPEFQQCRFQVNRPLAYDCIELYGVGHRAERFIPTVSSHIHFDN